MRNFSRLTFADKLGLILIGLMLAFQLGSVFFLVLDYMQQKRYREVIGLPVERSIEKPVERPSERPNTTTVTKQW